MRKETCCSQFPGGSHKLNKVVIVVDGGGDSGVVVVPLGLGDHTIVVFVTEVGEEFEVSFVFSDLSRDDFWMSVG